MTGSAVLDEDLAQLEAPPTRRRLAVIVNGHASAVTPRRRSIVLAALACRYEVEPLDTAGPWEAADLARDAVAAGADAVVTYGGDGTINEAANGIAGTGVPLFPLPGGSQNVFAKMLGLSADAVDATERLLALADDWHPRRVDLGRVNARRFVFSAGAGLDASVVERTDANPARKARWRQWYYAQIATRVYLRRYVLRPPRIEVQGPSVTLPGITVVVQNGAPYTYFGRHPVNVCRDVSLASGTLSAAVLERARPTDLPSSAVRLLVPRLELTDQRHVTSIPALRELTVRAVGDAPFAVQVDGDFLGRFERVTFGVEPGALTVIA